MQLVTHTLQHTDDQLDKLEVSGDHRFIADYLAADVFFRLPEDVQAFLLSTSILDRLSGSLCEAVTGREHCQDVLERLEREDLFLFALDDNRRWFRYHDLFRDFLAKQLERDSSCDLEQLHRRAANWYLASGAYKDAFYHAINGGDATLAADAAEHYFEVALLSGEFEALHNGLRAVPLDWRVEHAVFGLFEAGAYLFTGQLDEGMRCVIEVEQRFARSTSIQGQRNFARATAIRCAVACFQNDLPLAEDIAEAALENLPEADHTFLSAIHHALGDTYRRNALWDQARRRYLTVLTLEREPAFPIRAVHAYCALGDLELLRGDLNESEAYWRRALAAFQQRENWGRFPLPLIGWVQIRLGGIECERNRLEEARNLVEEGIERTELGGDVHGLIGGYLTAGRLELASGNIEEAAAYLERARPLVLDAEFPDLAGQFERLQLEIWLARDELRSAVSWADQILSDASSGKVAGDVELLAVARLLILKDDQPSIDQAARLLDRLIGRATEAELAGVEIEGRTLQALGRFRSGDRAGAMMELERALALAEPQHYLRVFLDLGMPMLDLLHEARSRQTMPHYLDRLLDAFGDHVPFGGEDAVLPEPLTDRELEILQLLAAGLTNSEIADELYISPQTVKKHAGNIYGKLAVRSRTEAAARARDLHLIAG
ncbi:MAG: LuxR C-terminal-related transcriptional regulator [Thermomicrobiales bacterium]